MGTMATIGIEEQDRTITAVTVHFDGMPDRVGRILAAHYSDTERLRSLLALGDLEVLAPMIAPEPETVHSYYDPQSDVCVAYLRDRPLDDAGMDPDGCRPKSFVHRGELLDWALRHGGRYAYLYETRRGLWLTVELRTFFTPLEDVLRLEDAEAGAAGAAGAASGGDGAFSSAGY